MLLYVFIEHGISGKEKTLMARIGHGDREDMVQMTFAAFLAKLKIAYKEELTHREEVLMYNAWYAAIETMVDAVDCMVVMPVLPRIPPKGLAQTKGTICKTNKKRRLRSGVTNLTKTEVKAATCATCSKPDGKRRKRKRKQLKDAAERYRTDYGNRTKKTDKRAKR